MANTIKRITDSLLTLEKSNITPIKKLGGKETSEKKKEARPLYVLLVSFQKANQPLKNDDSFLIEISINLPALVKEINEVWYPKKYPTVELYKLNDNIKIKTGRYTVNLKSDDDKEMSDLIRDLLRWVSKEVNIAEASMEVLKARFGVAKKSANLLLNVVNLSEDEETEEEEETILNPKFLKVRREGDHWISASGTILDEYKKINLDRLDKEINLFDKSGKLDLSFADKLQKIKFLLRRKRGEEISDAMAIITGDDVGYISLQMGGAFIFAGNKNEEIQESSFVASDNERPTYMTFVLENLGGTPEIATDSEINEVMEYLGSEHGDDSAIASVSVYKRIPTSEFLKPNFYGQHEKIIVERKRGFEKQFEFCSFVFGDTLLYQFQGIQEDHEDMIKSLPSAFILWEEVGDIGKVGWDDWNDRTSMIASLLIKRNKYFKKGLPAIMKLPEASRDKAVLALVKEAEGKYPIFEE